METSPPVTPISPLTPKPSISLNPILIVISAASLTLTSFFLYQNWLLNQKLRQLVKPQTTLVTPTPTCRPRPACLDMTPACKLPETPDMCPKPTFKFYDCGGPEKINCPSGKACKLFENYNVNPNRYGTCVPETETNP